MKATVIRLSTIAALACAPAALAVPAAEATPYVPAEVVVGYAAGPVASVAKAAASRMGVRLSASQPREQVLRLPPRTGVWKAIARLRRLPGVAYAVPNYIAHEAGSWIPERSRAQPSPGWLGTLQWNFSPTVGVNAPGAWANLIAAGHPAGAA